MIWSDKFFDLCNTRTGAICAIAALLALGWLLGWLPQ